MEARSRVLPIDLDMTIKELMDAYPLSKRNNMLNLILDYSVYRLGPRNSNEVNPLQFESKLKREIKRN